LPISLIVNIYVKYMSTTRKLSAVGLRLPASSSLDLAARSW
jgi:hypothetical protein